MISKSINEWQSYWADTICDIKTDRKNRAKIENHARLYKKACENRAELEIVVYENRTQLEEDVGEKHAKFKVRCVKIVQS